MGNLTKHQAFEFLADTITPNNKKSSTQAGRFKGTCPSCKGTCHVGKLASNTGQSYVNLKCTSEGCTIKSLALKHPNIFGQGTPLLHDNLQDIHYRYKNGAIRVRTANGNPKCVWQTKGGGKGSLYYSNTPNNNPKIFIVEGEKDADAISAAGGQGITAGAINDLAKANWEELAGKNVTVIPDEDKQGHEAMSQLINILEKTNINVTHVARVKPPCKDFADHYTIGGTLETLKTQSVQEYQQKYYQPKHQNNTDSKETKPERKLIISNNPPPLNPNLWGGKIEGEKLLPANEVTILAGFAGVGKSSLAAKWLAQFTNGQMEGIHHNTPVNTLVIGTEDEHAQWAQKIIANNGNPERMFYTSVITQTQIDGELIEIESNPTYDDLPRLGKLVEQENIKVIVIDPIDSLLPEKTSAEPTKKEVQTFLTTIQGLSKKYGLTIIGIIHRKKTGDKSISGSTAWRNVPRSVLYLTQLEEGDYLGLWQDKANRSKRMEHGLKYKIESNPIKQETVEADGFEFPMFTFDSKLNMTLEEAETPLKDKDVNQQDIDMRALRSLLDGHQGWVTIRQAQLALAGKPSSYDGDIPKPILNRWNKLGTRLKEQFVRDQVEGVPSSHHLRLKDRPPVSKNEWEAKQSRQQQLVPATTSDTNPLVVF